MPFTWFDPNKASPLSIILWLWLPMGLILSLAYRSNLLAMLVKNEYEAPIDTVDDAVASGGVLFVPEKTWPHEILKYSPSKKYQQLYVQRASGG